jgi:hypothetical protein
MNDINAGGFKITSLSDPTISTGLVTKNWI